MKKLDYNTKHIHTHTHVCVCVFIYTLVYTTSRFSWTRRKHQKGTPETGTPATDLRTGHIGSRLRSPTSGRVR